MGVILSGILGGFSGKVGPVVGANWKTIDYMRKYSIPENPNTVNQQTVRTKFAALVDIARRILSTVLQPYWDPFYTNMSGFNAFIKENYTTVDGSNKLQTTSILSKGTLDPSDTISAVYTTGSGQVQVTWSDAIEGNGLGTDDSNAVIYDTTTGKMWASSSLDTRANGTGSFTIDAGLTATNLLCWQFFSRGTGGSLIVSDSIGDTCAAP
jgi:hypothetical protein